MPMPKPPHNPLLAIATLSRRIAARKIYIHVTRRIEFLGGSTGSSSFQTPIEAAAVSVVLAAAPQSPKAAPCQPTI